MTLARSFTADIHDLVSEEGLQSFLGFARYNDHEMTMSMRSDSITAIAEKRFRRAASARGIESPPIEAFLYVPDISGNSHSEELLAGIDFSTYAKFGVGCVPDLDGDDFESYEIEFNDGMRQIISAWTSPNFPCIIIGPVQDEGLAPAVITLGKGTAISIDCTKLRCYFTSKIDPWPFGQPELYCCARPDGVSSWRINSGSDPWGKVNDSGTAYSINEEIFDHHIDTLFDVAFRDMDGLTPDPDHKNGDGKYTDDDMGIRRDIDSTTLTTTATVLETNDTIRDNNDYTTSTSQKAYFWLKK